MKVTLSNILSFLRKGLSTIDLKVYAICVFIASFIWLLITLSDNYTDEIEFPVTYVNYPEGMVLVSKPTKYITAQVESQGYELATATLSNRETVKIDLSRLRIKRSAYGRYIAAIPTSEFRYNIINQLKVDDVGKSFKPDSIYFVFDSLKTKKLKVRLLADIKCAKGFTQYGEAEISPDYVIAEGPALDLKKIRYVNTDSLLLADVKQDISQDVGLKPIGDFISLNTKKVKLGIRIEKFSDFSISVPVTVLSNVPNLKVKTFPSMVKINCSMALPDYKLLTDSSFQVTARLDSLDLLSGNKVILNISKKPSSAKSVILSDESIEYVIIK
jgi:hypothetical protein